MKLFVEYNECTQSEYVNYDQTQNRGRDKFNLSIRPGLDLNSLSVNSTTSDMFNLNFGKKLNYRLGVEVEYVLPFFKNKWSLSTEPAYISFSAEAQKETASVAGDRIIAKVDYRAMEIPLSLRYYSFINGSSKIFFNVSFVTHANFSQPLIFLRTDGSTFRDFNMATSSAIAGGVGYKYKNKLSAEIRSYQSRRVTAGTPIFSDYRSTTIILGYSLF